jgi:hypothetical protein
VCSGAAAIVLLAGLGYVQTARAAETVEKTKWREFDAYRISDGRTEAVIVPQLGGRLMTYRLVGGENWIWDGVAGAEKDDVPLMWGGDKTYIGPHSMWRFTQPKSWPPPAPDAAAHEAEVIPSRRRLMACGTCCGRRARSGRGMARG